MNATLLTGLIGLLVSLAVFTGSVLLPIVNRPRTSWREATLGIVPAAICSLVFFGVTIVGLVRTGHAAPAARSRREVAAVSTLTPGAVLSWLAAVLLTLVGLGLAGVFLPSSLENRRVWLHQQNQVDLRVSELRELEGRPDPASQQRAEQLRKDLRTWHPDGHREAFQIHLGLALAGVACVVVAIALVLFRLLSRPKPHDQIESTWGRRATRPSDDDY